MLERRLRNPEPKQGYERVGVIFLTLQDKYKHSKTSEVSS